jgi:hypothetical protein
MKPLAAVGEGIELLQCFGVGQPVRVSYQVVGVEHLLIDMDSVKELFVIEFQIIGLVECFLTIRARVVVGDPAVDALHVEDVIATENAAQ